MFSKLRASIAGLYAWRVSHAADAEDKERMAHEADFAFHQAWALCPYSPEAVFRYVNFLVEQKRLADAVLVAETSAKMPERQGAEGTQLRALVEQLKKFQQRQ
jgi:thioredoxin-like negative regulator of GroEL